MTWLRAPNNARRMREVEADLGPVIGQLEPIRPLPKHSYGTPHWMVRGWPAVLGWCAVTAWALVIMVWLWLAFIVLAATRPAKAQERASAAAIADCTADALTYCAKHLVPLDRPAVRDCMIRHRAKLFPNCKRHVREK